MPTARILAALWFCTAAPLAAQSGATALLDRGIARMGGDSLLRSVRSVRLDVMTQWLRTSFATAPFADQPAYERNVELRDYAGRSWRNSRYVSPFSPAPGVVDIVSDTIAARLLPSQSGGEPTWDPLNVAYVTERRELFGMAPERLLLTLRDDRTVRMVGDTIIDGEPHTRLAARIEGWDVVVLIRLSDALPVMVRFRADETADFGLAPWAEHEIEFWYSNWRMLPPGILIPLQRDTRRVGRTYKRMTLLAATINAPAPADSFAISDSVRTAFFATENRPMWQIDPTGQARIEREHFAILPPQLGTAGAVQIGGMWVLIEAGQASGAVEIAARWLRDHGGGSFGAAIAAMPATGNGGAPWFVSRRLPLIASPGTAPYLRVVLGSNAGVTLINSPRWIKIGTDSVWVEPVSAPDLSGAMAVYSPALRWLYLPFAGSPSYAAEQSAVIERLEKRGFAVELLGGRAAIVMPR